MILVLDAGLETEMDRASALLAALRARAVLGSSRLKADAVEALAGVLGLMPEELPALVDRLQRDGHVALVWGGALDVLPERAAAAGGGGTGGPTITLQGVTFGPGATIAGHDATGGTVRSTPEDAFGALAGVLGELRLLRPELAGEAAKAADDADRALSEVVKPQATAEARRSWAGNARAALGRLFDVAPKAKALLDIGEKALGAIT
jgi:hypothetical protein